MVRIIVVFFQRNIMQLIAVMLCAAVSAHIQTQRGNGPANRHRQGFSKVLLVIAIVTHMLERAEAVQVSDWMLTSLNLWLCVCTARFATHVTDSAEHLQHVVFHETEELVEAASDGIQHVGRSVALAFDSVIEKKTLRCWV